MGRDLRKRVPFKTSPDRHRLLKVLAAELGTSVQALLEHAVNLLLADHEASTDTGPWAVEPRSVVVPVPAPVAASTSPSRSGPVERVEEVAARPRRRSPRSRLAPRPHGGRKDSSL